MKSKWIIKYESTILNATSNNLNKKWMRLHGVHKADPMHVSVR